jgi:polyhydroxyalkanoate synthesis repressor PhaR
MPVIKRYSNRKLYDSESKRYVTLEDLADFVRKGEDVRVVDHVTGEDLTSVTLLQVIFEQEKKIGGLMPQVFLTRLIRAGGDTVSALRGRLSALDPFQIFDEEIRRRILALVEQGRLTEDEGRRIQDLLVRRSTSPGGVNIPVKGEEESSLSGLVESTIPDEELVDPQELATLLRQVDALEQELQRLKEATPPAGAQSA